MSRSTRFPVAIHILVALTLRGRLNSDELAWSIGTNPSMVRRILASLSKAGLVVSQPGPSGGAELARDPRHVTLLEVLRAVELRPASGVHVPNPECPLGSVLEEPLCSVLRQAEEAAEGVLAAKNIHAVSRIARRRIVRSQEAGRGKKTGP